MSSVAAVAVAWLSDDFPGWVEVELTEADGTVHVVRDKQPVFGDEALTADCDYPRPTRLGCSWVEQAGPGLLKVALAHGLESEDGRTTFVVPESAVAQAPPPA